MAQAAMRSTDASYRSAHLWALIPGVVLLALFGALLNMIYKAVRQFPIEIDGEQEGAWILRKDAKGAGTVVAMFKGWQRVQREALDDGTISVTRHAWLAAACVGTGAQILFTFLLVLAFGICDAIDFLPTERGETAVTTLILAFTLSGSLGGYVTARTLASLHANSRNVPCYRWLSVACSGAFFPGSVIAVVLCAFAAIAAESANGSSNSSSSDVVGITAAAGGIGGALVRRVAVLASLLLLVHFLLSVVGAVFGFRALRKTTTARVREDANSTTSTTPSSTTGITPEERRTPTSPLRETLPPKRRCLASSIAGTLLLPLFSFSTIILELDLYMQAVWAGNAPRSESLAWIVVFFALWAATVCAVVALHVHCSLSNEQSRWQWASIRNSGGFGLHVAMSSVYFYFMRVPARAKTPTRALQFFVFAGVLSIAYGLAAAALGFATASAFVTFVYKQLPGTTESRYGKQQQSTPQPYFCREGEAQCGAATTTVHSESRLGRMRTRVVTFLDD